MAENSKKNRSCIKAVGVFVILYIIWIMLTSSLKPEELATGAIISAIVAFMTKDYVSDIPRTCKRGIWFLLYIPYFIWLMIKANLDVVYRVLHPALPINPGIVEIKTIMKSDIGKLALANSITLTPGTLTMDVIGDRLFIHWINVKDSNIKEASKDIAAPFEKFLRRIYP